MANIKAFNTKIAANKGTVIDVPNPLDGTFTGFKITILGKDSDAYRKVEAEQRERAIRSANTIGTFKISSEMVEENTRELLLACIITWEGLEGDDGIEIPFSKEAAKDLLKESPYIREVLDRNIGDRSLFTAR